MKHSMYKSRLARNTENQGITAKIVERPLIT